MRQVELVQLQEESVAKQEAKKYEIQKQIEAERRATEQYRVPLCPALTRHPALCMTSCACMSYCAANVVHEG